MVRSICGHFMPVTVSCIFSRPPTPGKFVDMSDQIMYVRWGCTISCATPHMPPSSPPSSPLTSHPCPLKQITIVHQSFATHPEFAHDCGHDKSNLIHASDDECYLWSGFDVQVTRMD
ncbi:hypothetical protein Dimus_006502 [Dionaea muscipula]